MPWNIVLRPDIQDFINTHDDADIRDLALRKPPDASWPYPLIIDQIKARQKAGDKIPQWVETPGVVFPLSSVLEQASSLATARYKARLVTGQSFADLTGGCGVDAFGMS